MVGPILSQVAREVAKNPSLWRIAAETFVRAAAMFAANETGKAAVNKLRKGRKTGRRSSRNRR